MPSPKATEWRHNAQVQNNQRTDISHQMKLGRNDGRIQMTAIVLLSYQITAIVSLSCLCENGERVHIEVQMNHGHACALHLGVCRSPVYCLSGQPIPAPAPGSHR